MLTSRPKLIRDYTDLEILAETSEGDAICLPAKTSVLPSSPATLSMMPHTLASEFFRDVEAGLSPEVPYNYFPQK
ncbi:Homoserine O-succinyltransferase [Kluyvera cryocrescens]|uniref:Homoserine O-succinyltransferase n=1 Tax=Kluyvera cryocrescens TaxID=580 RepID=A0A485B9F4_KLUCR|nr:Homoserine O-succinyltransferase [Kluyvera cryocrescens]